MPHSDQAVEHLQRINPFFVRIVGNTKIVCGQNAALSAPKHVATTLLCIALTVLYYSEMSRAWEWQGPQRLGEAVLESLQGRSVGENYT